MCHYTHDKLCIVFHSADSQRTQKKRNMHGGKEDDSPFEGDNVDSQELGYSYPDTPPIFNVEPISFNDLTKGTSSSYISSYLLNIYCMHMLDVKFIL